MNQLTSKFVPPFVHKNPSGIPPKTPFQSLAARSILFCNQFKAPETMIMPKPISTDCSLVTEKCSKTESPKTPADYSKVDKEEVKEPGCANDSISPMTPAVKSALSESNLTTKAEKPKLCQNVSVIKETENVENYQEKKHDELYYSVIYSGTNRKKSKSQDGIMILTLKKLTLLDEKGIKLSECPNKLNAKSLRPGELLTMGNNRKVEVVQKISRKDYLSGRCFLTNSCLSIPEPKCLAPKVQFEVPENSFVLDQVNKVYVERFLAEKLRPHQKEGVKFMYECLAGYRFPDYYGCILADSMGLGKTLQAVTLLYTLLRKDAPYESFAKKGIIVAPATLVGNWKQELSKWLGPMRLTPVVCSGNGKEKKNLLTIFEKGPSSLLIISYDTFVKHAASLSKVCQIIICDEGHLLKNCVTKKNSSISNLACQKRILLTGTPLQNNLNEFYACVSLVNPGVLGDLQTFNKIYAAPILKAQEPGASITVTELAKARSEELWRVTAKFILRRTGSILESLLPPRNEYLVFCKPFELQKKIYSQVLDSKWANLAVESGNTTNALAICSLLRKLVNHPDLVFMSEGKTEEFKEFLKIAEKCKQEDYWKISDRYSLSSKFKLAYKIIKKSEEKGEKIVIVSSFTKTLDLFERLLNSESIQYFRLDGSTLANKRMPLVNEFNSAIGHRVFLLSSKAGGCGLNLIGANRLILFDPDWNPSNDKQAMGRIWRDGQKLPVHIYRLFLSGTIEEKIYQRQTVKENLSSTIVDAKQGVSKFSKEYIREIFTVFEKCTTFETSDKFNETEGTYLEDFEDCVELVKKVNSDWDEVKQEDLDFTEANQDYLEDEPETIDIDIEVKKNKKD